MMRATTESTEISARLFQEFSAVRSQSEMLCHPLSPEDMMVQSCSEASPAKWHLAHTTWFFETFLLREFLPGYREFHPDFRWLFNSYYNSVSDQPEKKLRASFSRPPVDVIFRYRQHVQAGMELLLSSNPPEEVSRRIILGLHHEQQHQELLATDMKHALWTNPLRPAYLDQPVDPERRHRDEGSRRSLLKVAFLISASPAMDSLSTTSCRATPNIFARLS